MNDDNLKLPAYPTDKWFDQKDGEYKAKLGFTKLELASLIIAQGLMPFYNAIPDKKQRDTLAKVSILMAQSILEEANK